MVRQIQVHLILGSSGVKSYDKPWQNTQRVLSQLQTMPTTATGTCWRSFYICTGQPAPGSRGMTRTNDVKGGFGRFGFRPGDVGWYGWEANSYGLFLAKTRETTTKPGRRHGYAKMRSSEAHDPAHDKRALT